MSMSRKHKVIIALVCTFVFIFSVSVIGITGIQNSWNVSYDYISYANTAYATLFLMLLCLTLYGIAYALMSQRVKLLIVSILSLLCIGSVCAITGSMYNVNFWQHNDGGGPGGAYITCGAWSGAIDVASDTFPHEVLCATLETPSILTLRFNTSAFIYGTPTKEYIFVCALLVSSQLLLIIGICRYLFMPTPRKQ